MAKTNPNLGYGAYLSGEITPGYAAGSNPITLPEQEAEYNDDPQPAQEESAMMPSILSDPMLLAGVGILALLFVLRRSSGRIGK